MNKIELLEYVTDKVETGMNGTIGIIELLEQNGITDNMHVGKPKEFFEDVNHVVEWYLGQYISIINNQSWFAMNSLINSSYTWLEKQKEETINE